MNKFIAGLATFVTPLVSFAQVINDADDIVTFLYRWGNMALNGLIFFAVLYIVWTIVRYVVMSGDAEKRDEAKSQIMWGIIGLVVILSIWGIVNIIRSTFNTGPNTVPVRDIPVLQDRRF